DRRRAAGRFRHDRAPRVRAGTMVASRVPQSARALNQRSALVQTERRCHECVVSSEELISGRYALCVILVPTGSLLLKISIVTLHRRASFVPIDQQEIGRM